MLNYIHLKRTHRCQTITQSFQQKQFSLFKLASFLLSVTIINFMSIINSYFQYLLGVAEKIIIKCADSKTKQKYFSLKDQVFAKSFQTQSSHLTISSHEKSINKSMTVLKTSALNRSNTKIGKNTRQSVQKNKQNRRDDMQRGRIQTFSSKATEKSDKQQRALIHMATVIKNAEACPHMLKTITFLPNQFNERINSIIKAISQSLTLIYSSITGPKQEQSLQLTTIQPKPQFNQLITDNRWLINKLETIVDQNIVLRRMIGQRI